MPGRGGPLVTTLPRIAPDLFCDGCAYTDGVSRKDIVLIDAPSNARVGLGIEANDLQEVRMVEFRATK